LRLMIAHYYAQVELQLLITCQNVKQLIVHGVVNAFTHT